MKFRTLLSLALLNSTCLGADSSVPFKLYPDHLIVTKCSVGNTPDLTAMLDTGVSETVLDLALTRRLSLPVNKGTDVALFLDHPSPVDTVLIPSIRLGPVQAEDLPGIASDLSHSTGELGIRPDLIIGMDVLHRQSFEIDYKNRRLIFGAALPMRWNAKLNGNTRFSTIDSVVMGKRLRLQVDSGSTGLLIYGRRFGPIAETAAANRDLAVASLKGTTQTIAVDSADIQVGNWHTSRGTVFFSGENSPVTDFDGVLGLWTLRPRRVAFDFLQMMLSWE